MSCPSERPQNTTFFLFNHIKIETAELNLNQTAFYSASRIIESHCFPLLFPPLCFAQGRDAFYVL